MTARIGGALLVALVLGLPVYVAGIAWELNASPAAGAALHIDFVAFWAAAKLALAGEAAAAFDAERLVAAQALATPEAWETYRWHYPPAFQLVIAPLGLLAFTPAFAVFSAVALGFYVWALRGWVHALPGGLGFAVAAPPVAFVLATGNATLLWAAALLAALAALACRRALAAGAMIALLTLKPQLGLLIPVALVAGRYWATILWAALGAASLVVLSIAAFGIAPWAAFFLAMTETAGLYELYGENAVTMVTWYAFARQFGLGHDAALALQGGLFMAAATAVWLAWSRREAPFDLKVATLCLATLAATPYAYQYELVLAVVAAVFLARAGVGQVVWGRAWLAALWLLPVPGWLFEGLQIAHYAAPALSFSAATAAFLALRREATPAPS